jgi:hypothetical protein
VILEPLKGMAVSKTVRVLMTAVSLTNADIVKTEGVSK